MTEEPQPPFGTHLGEWLAGRGPEVDIAICTRIRLARNIQGYSFSTMMSQEEAAELADFVKQQLQRSDFVEALQVLDVGDLEELVQRVLIERHLISREFAGADRARCVAFNENESVAIMVNEEDHIRAQVFQSGLRIHETFDRAQTLDEDLMQHVPLAFSEEFGFLTTCPTNTGTGLRVSVMLHLPGLVWAEEIQRAINSAQKIHMAVRGLYGEGSRALGDFYQISNQVTLGRSEDQILGDVESAVQRIVVWERDVRDALMRGEQRPRTENRVFRALGVLERARILSSEEALNCLSGIRFGVQQGLIEDLSAQQINRALLLSQPAHLQRLCHAPLSAGERDLKRAALIREVLEKA